MKIPGFTILFSLALSAGATLAGPPADRSGLEREAGTLAHAELDPASGRVRRMRWMSTPPRRGRPAEAARSFLERHRDAFGVLAGAGGLSEGRTQSTTAGHHVRLRRTVAGLPLHGSEIAVDVDRLGAVRRIACEGADATTLATGPWRVTAGQAIGAAMRHMKINGALRGKITTAEEAFPDGELPARPAWRVRIAAVKPLGDWEVMVDRIDGSIRAVANRMRGVNGSGQVFDPNPVVTLQNIGLRDANHSSTAVPSGAYLTVTLQGLDGSGLLKGEFADVFTQLTDTVGNSLGAVRRASEPGLRFFYDRSREEFRETTTYFQIDQAARFIHDTLGFPNVIARAVGVNANAFADDNSFFSPDTGRLLLGTGGVPDGEDGDVIVHEYGHAVQEDQIPGFGSGSEAGAIGEGFSDILAVLSASARGQTFNVPVFADWDATTYSTANPPALRRVDGNKFYPRDLQGEVHRDGEIWSGALWEVRNLLGGGGAGDRGTLKLLLQSHFSLTPSATFKDAANAVLAADSDLNAGANIALLRGVFVRRGLLTASAAPVVSGAVPRSGSNRSASSVVVTGFAFTGATAVSLSGPANVAISTFAVLDDARLSMTVPPGLRAGSYVISVTARGETGAGPGRFHADDHPDDAASVTLAERFPPGGSAAGNIADGRDGDVFAVPVQGGGSYTLRVSAPGDIDTVLRVLAADGTTQLAENDDISTTNHNSLITEFVPAVSGTIFLRVTGFDGRATGDYTVSVEGPGGVDLFVSAVAGPPALVIGQGASVTAEVRNLGSQASGGFDLEVRLTGESAGAVAGGIAQVGRSVAPSLAAQGVASLTVALPALSRSLAPGVYRVSVIADASNGLVELDESNNSGTASAAVTLTSTEPDSAFTLSAQGGLSLVALEAAPFTPGGGRYGASDLARDLGATYVVRAVADASGVSRFEVFMPGGGAPSFELEGNRGYLVSLPGSRQTVYRGLPWPAGTERVQLLKGFNILAYPYGVPAGERPQDLLNRTGGVFVTDTIDGATSDRRFSAVLSGQAKSAPTLRGGRGYLVLTPAPPSGAIVLPR